MDARTQDIIRNTVKKWRDNLMQTGPANMAEAEKIIKETWGPDTQIFTVQTPKQFYVAQAVIRGYMTKDHAKHTVCPALDLNPAFIKTLRRGGTMATQFAHTWGVKSSEGPASAMAKLDQEIRNECMILAHTDPLPPQFQGRAVELTTGFGSDLEQRITYGMTSNGSWLNPTRTIADGGTGRAVNMATIRHVTYAPGGQSAVKMSHISVWQAIAQYATVFAPEEGGGAIQWNRWWRAPQLLVNDIMYQLMGVTGKERAVIDLLNTVPGFMIWKPNSRSKKTTILVMTDRPTVCVNASGELHNETGPAVAYADGTKAWYIEGHRLEEAGEKIIMTPEKLNVDEIRNLNNEEERRIAIERIGWERYLVETGATVLDRRVNSVDNTVEALIELPERPAQTSAWRNQPKQRVIMLACRSTARKYTIGVPGEDMRGPWRRESFSIPTLKAIATCEQAQKFMADGSRVKYLKPLRHPLNIIGAS